MAIEIKGLLKLMVQKDISDIHFKADSFPAFRLHGAMVMAANLQKTAPQDIQTMADQLMNEEQRKVFKAEQELDLAYSLEGVSRFRVNVCMQRGSVCLTLRVIPMKLRSFEDLNLPAETMKKLAEQGRGLILFAGITGAGKTTTMNCFLNYINETCPYRVITIEDPIEFYHPDIKSSVVQREVGRDTKSFASALRHVLRQDPDVVVVGEMRDLETMQAALNAAETGHLVLSTVHTMDAVQTMDRIVDTYPAHQHNQVRQQLANTLRGIVAQRLVPSKDGKARFPATEILIGSNMVRGQITEGKSSEIYKVMEGGAYYGMHSFDQDLVRLYQEGKIDQKSVVDNSTSPQDVTIRLQGLSGGAEG
ncbi:MAG: PilT/PilU family type 4a pilus ATPase [Elusimicrobia bacterium]|nr:PilT/PilU family type 4a pilus ATPase [Elusimicrobiota bacterium]